MLEPYMASSLVPTAELKRTFQTLCIMHARFKQQSNALKMKHDDEQKGFEFLSLFCLRSSKRPHVSSGLLSD